MSQILVFPGQGSQKKGMGKELFDTFPNEVAQADDILGYSIRDLCLEDKDKNLRETQFTQPALFVVNALHFLAWKRDHGRLPDAVAGHSLGEYNALFAAGVFDFATGVRMVQQRGALMSQAKQGSMAAVIGMNPDQVAETLKASGLAELDIANMNTPDQIVIAGPPEQLQEARPFFKEAGARFIPLNVSAAFHSRYMRPASESFAKFLSDFQFSTPTIPVIANVSARPYPAEVAQVPKLLAEQIASSVRWYESVSYMLTYPDAELSELGPGQVLTKMIKAISANPMKLDVSAAQPVAPAGTEVTLRGSAIPKNARLAYLFSGNGSQYYRMGEALYQNHPVFRQHFDDCSRLAEPVLGQSLADLLFHGPPATDPFDQLPQANAANFSLGYALSKTLADKGLYPDMVMGYGIGEFLAATVAEGLKLEDGLQLAILHGQLVTRNVTAGGMIAVFQSPEFFESRPELFTGTSLACHNFHRHIVVSGAMDDLKRAMIQCRQQDITCQFLPIHHPLHTAALDIIEADFRYQAERISFHPLKKPMYSPTSGCWQARLSADTLWSACRDQVQFATAIKELAPRVGHFIDLGPSGTLATFAGYQLDDKSRGATVINRFGRNLETLNILVDRFGS